MKTKNLLTSILKSLFLLFMTDNVVAQCPASFSSTGNYTSTCNMYEFINTSVAPPGSSYEWRFGDGAMTVTTSTANVYHQYAFDGVYSTSLTVMTSTATGCGSAIHTVTVSCGNTFSCQPSFTYSLSANTAYFTAVNLGNGSLYQWDFGDGQTAWAGSSTTASHTYTNINGYYAVTLYVFAPGSNVISPCSSSTQSVSLGSGNFCQAAYSYTNNANCNAAFFVNNSTGNGNTYFWDFGDGTTNITTSTAWFAHYFPASGSYAVRLDVYAPSNTVTPCSSTQHTISASCPTLACQAAYTYTNGNCWGVSLSNNSTGGSSNTYFWDFGDGNTSTSSSNYFTHQYTANGSYVIKLDVFAPGNTVTPCSSTQNTLAINCPSLACQANSDFTLFADTANPGNYFAYNNSTGTGSLSYLWDFGDGNTSSQQYPFHQYAVPGQYVVCLQVTSLTNSITCSDTYCDSSSVQRMAAGFQMSSITVIPQTVTGIKQNELVKSLTAYPNPFKDELAIEIELNANTSNISYEVYDAIGKVVLKNTITDSKTIINTSSLNNGFYFLSVKDENGNTLRALKIVK